ncbi:MAG: YetF domain-containing protein [Caldimonas sp.]
MEELALQAAKAAVYYLGLIVLLRFAGKRLAGQTTTFDLIVLITLGVVLQTTALEKGAANALVFVGTVFAMHKLVAMWCAKSDTVRHWVRGKPRTLVRDGKIIDGALQTEGVSEEELSAGLRKLGHADPSKVKIATLEETGHISAVPMEGS